MAPKSQEQLKQLSLLHAVTVFFRDHVPTAFDEAKIEGYSRHCNRHTFASRLVMAGVNLRSVAGCPDSERFRWLCAIPISLLSIKLRPWIGLSSVKIEGTPKRTLAVLIQSALM
jgi:hypothetical protein